MRHSGCKSWLAVYILTASSRLIRHHNSYLFGWFIFTFILWLLTLKSTVAFNLLLLTVWVTYLCLGISYLDAQNSPEGAPNVPWTRAGGGFGIVAAFLAWYVSADSRHSPSKRSVRASRPSDSTSLTSSRYNMLAGLADATNSFFVVPVVHFPWSEKAREDKRKAAAGEDKQNV